MFPGTATIRDFRLRRTICASAEQVFEKKRLGNSSDSGFTQDRLDYRAGSLVRAPKHIAFQNDSQSARLPASNPPGVAKHTGRTARLGGGPLSTCERQ